MRLRKQVYIHNFVIFNFDNSQILGHEDSIQIQTKTNHWDLSRNSSIQHIRAQHKIL
jgi:hypothetical protein